MTDSVVWTRAAVRRELQHLICCEPDRPPCNLRRGAGVDKESTGRTRGAPEWAGFQLASHSRGDVLTAIAEVFDIPAGFDWEHLRAIDVRALPPLVQALWVIIIRGPSRQHDDRPRIPDQQKPASM